MSELLRGSLEAAGDDTLSSLAEAEYRTESSIADNTRNTYSRLCAEYGVTAAHLGVDLELGTVDGEHLGPHICRVVLRLRQQHPSHYYRQVETE